MFFFVKVLLRVWGAGGIRQVWERACVQMVWQLAASYTAVLVVWGRKSADQQNELQHDLHLPTSQRPGSLLGSFVNIRNVGSIKSVIAQLIRSLRVNKNIAAYDFLTWWLVPPWYSRYFEHNVYISYFSSGKDDHVVRGIYDKTFCKTLWISIPFIL